MAENNNGFLASGRARLNLRRFLFYFITLAGILVIFSQISEFRLLGGVFLRSKLAWLAAIIVFQYFFFHFSALNYRDVLRVQGLTVGVNRLLPMVVAVQFLNQAIPLANVSGQAFFVQWLKRYGVSVAEGISRAVLELVTLYIAFAVFFLAAAGLMLKRGLLAGRPELVSLVYLFVFFVVLFSWLFLALQKKRRGRIAGWVINRLHRYFESSGKANHSGHVASLLDQFRASVSVGVLTRNKSKLFWATLWQGLQLVMHILTLYFIGQALGIRLDFPAAFAAYTLSRFIAMVSFVPGALGIFEGGMTLILVSFGLPADQALAVTLLFRLFTFWLPMPIGWILYRKYSSE